MALKFHHSTALVMIVASLAATMALGAPAYAGNSGAGIRFGGGAGNGGAVGIPASTYSAIDQLNEYATGATRPPPSASPATQPETYRAIPLRRG